LKHRIEYAFRWATSRKPDAEELNILEELFKAEIDEFQKYPERADAFLDHREARNNPELAAYAVVANAIINLSESLQKN